MNEIILFPVSGLGNRISAIESAVRIAEDKHFDLLTILWDTTTVPCKIEGLLKILSDKCTIEVKTVKGGEGKSIFDKVLHALMVRIYSFGADKSVPLLDGSELGRISADKFPSSGRVFIKACTEFYAFDKIEHVAFDDSFEKEVKDILSGSGRCIGVHIRRGDNMASSEESITEDFIRQIGQVISEDNRVKFFLATDDQKTEEAIKKEFPGYIITQPAKSYERFSVRGQHEAVIDMLALSKTEYILGSYYSSFTDMAAKLGGIHSEIVKKK